MAWFLNFVLHAALVGLFGVLAVEGIQRCPSGQDLTPRAFLWAWVILTSCAAAVMLFVHYLKVM